MSQALQKHLHLEHLSPLQSHGRIMTQFPTSAVATMASPSMAPAMAATPRITTVEWQMLDKKRC